MKPEELLVNELSEELLDNYPKIPFRFDQIDQVGRFAGVKNKAIHGKWSRGYPDLLIASGRGGYSGLYLELKATEVVADTEHTRTQAAYHRVLRFNGFSVGFCCGSKECKKAIKTYMKLKRNKTK